MSSDADCLKPEFAGRKQALAGGLVSALATLLILVATERPLAIVWDEGYTLMRLERVRAWCAAVRDPAAAARAWNPRRLERLQDRRAAPRADQLDTRGELFEAATLAWFWPFAREEPHGHPPFYALVALVGDAAPGDLEQLTRARLGSMLVFSLTAGALFRFGALRWGTWSAAAATGAFVLHPHLFALAHYATYDALLACLWLGATLAFAAVVERPPGPIRWGMTLGFGVLLGCAMATKLTGWLLPVPLVCWAALLRSRVGMVTVCVGGLVGLLVFWMLCPPLWSNPIEGVRRFLESNLSRSQTIPIKTRFLGRDYETPNGSLPWYNALVWLLMANPLGVLTLAVAGGIGVVRGRFEPLGSLFLASAAFMFILRSLPHTPGHDGTRQLAAGLAGMAPLCGLGARWLLRAWPRAGRAVVAAVLVEAGASVALMMPVPLSYFSPLVGGLPGATALGMEPTYYWDSMTDHALKRLDARSAAGASVVFAAHPTAWYYKESGRLNAGLYPFEGKRYAWYVMQNRPGSMSPMSRALVRRLGGRREYMLSEKFGVPLAWAFPASEIERMTPAAEGR